MIPLVYKGILLKNAMGFNRTFMELKLSRKATSVGTRLRFNRTFMELKPFQVILNLQCRISFNRTFMELKHDKRQRAEYTDAVLIGPSWN